MATPIPANRARFTLEEIVRVTGGRIARSPDPSQRMAAFGNTSTVVGEGVFTDTRAAAPNGIFVALKGESHDGHAFLPTAAERGAAIAVVEKDRLGKIAEAALASMAIVEVDDTLVALGDLARDHLERWRRGSSSSRGARKVVAITGSAGKTTTKELTAALLAEVGPAHRTAGNLNNRIGVPLVVLGLGQEHRFSVLEMGMSLPGELDAITSIARPDVSIITNVGMAHAEGVGGPEGVLREKSAVVRALHDDGVAILNADDALTMRAAEVARGATIVTFGKSPDATIRLERRTLGADGTARIDLARGGAKREIVSFRFGLPGEAAAIDLAAALAAQEAASGVVLSAEAIERAVATVALEGRASIKALGSGVVVLDDTYNANPASVRAALATLTEIARGRRRIAVLGEMKELGDHAEVEHDALGDVLAASGVAVVIGCGGLVDRTLARAATHGAVEVVAAPSVDAATRELLTRVRPGDAVLVKGSRSVGAERVVAALTEAWPAAAKSAWSSGEPGGAIAPSGRGEPPK